MLVKAYCRKYCGNIDCNGKNIPSAKALDSGDNHIRTAKYTWHRFVFLSFQFVRVMCVFFFFFLYASLALCFRAQTMTTNDNLLFYVGCVWYTSEGWMISRRMKSTWKSDTSHNSIHVWVAHSRLFIPSDVMQCGMPECLKTATFIPLATKCERVVFRSCSNTLSIGRANTHRRFFLIFSWRCRFFSISPSWHPFDFILFVFALREWTTRVHHTLREGRFIQMHK